MEDADLTVVVAGGNDAAAARRYRDRTDVARIKVWCPDTLHLESQQTRTIRLPKYVAHVTVQWTPSTSVPVQKLHRGITRLQAYPRGVPVERSYERAVSAECAGEPPFLRHIHRTAPRAEHIDIS